MFSFQTVFYVGGAVGLAWFAIWLLLVADEPKTHWFISDFEKRYILANRYGFFTFFVVTFCMLLFRHKAT